RKRCREPGGAAPSARDSHAPSQRAYWQARGRGLESRVGNGAWVAEVETSLSASRPPARKINSWSSQPSGIIGTRRACRAGLDQKKRWPKVFPGMRGSFGILIETRLTQG